MTARPPRLLIVSPVASHPPVQGNAARILALGEALAARGILCEFLYYTAEGMLPAQEAAMRAFWPALHIWHKRPKPEPRFPDAWGIDDWCPAGFAEHAAGLQRARRFDAVLASYVWMSRVLEGVEGALRILDTHDLFGGRHLLARARGLDPSWYFTTEAEEARGLARADLVLAIQAEEAVALAARGARRVLTVGHAPPPRFLAAPPPPAPGTRFGVLASAHPWNAAAVGALDAALAGQGLDWLLAGSILGRRDLRLVSGPLLLDPLPEVAAFYDAVGCVVSPMAGGTGLTIKTVEALMQGRPVLGTADAFRGLDAAHPAHRVPAVADLVPLMAEHARSEAFRAEVALASRRLALGYAAMVAVQQDALAAAIAAAALGCRPPPHGPH